jgi:two-component system response regulator YesN
MGLIMSRGKKKVFVKLFKSYIIILLIPILIGIYIYQNTINTVKNDSLDHYLLQLEQCISILDKRFAEINDLAFILSKNPRFRELLYLDQPIAKEKVCSVYALHKEISPYFVTNSFIRTLHVYLKNSDIILTPKVSYLRPAFFYETSFKFSNLSLEEWNNIVFSKFYNNGYLPVEDTSIDDIISSTITYIQTLPYENPTDIRGAVAIFIDKDKIEDILNGITSCQNSLFYIKDSEGKMILYSGGCEENIQRIDKVLMTSKSLVNKEISGKRYSVISSTSKLNDWTYVVAIPLNVAMEKANLIQKTALFIFAAFILLGLGFSYYFSYINSKPIREIVKRVKSMLNNNTYHNNDDYEFLNKNISALIETNRYIEGMVKTQLPIIKSAFLDRLLNGKFNSTIEIASYLSFIEADFSFNGYIVMMLCTGDYGADITEDISKELTAKTLIISDYLIGYFGTKALCAINDDKIVVILGLGQSETSDYENYIRNVSDKIVAEFSRKYGIEVLISVGNIYYNIIDVHLSFEEAKEAILHVPTGKTNKIIWYNKIEKCNISYHYPIEVEKRLLNVIRSGNSDETRTILKEIYKKNFVFENRSVKLIRNLIFELYDTATWLAITTLSEDSIAMGSAPVPFPDFTNGKWINREPSHKSKFALNDVYDDLF